MKLNDKTVRTIIPEFDNCTGCQYLYQHINELKKLISEAWDAGAAHTIGSHELFKQTHPSKTEWMKSNVG